MNAYYWNTSALLSSGDVLENLSLGADYYAVAFFGGNINNATVGKNGDLCVSAGGKANDTIVNSWGFVHVESGGLANGTVLKGGGKLYVSQGGTATNTTANSGGLLKLSAGATANVNTLNENGSLFVSGTANSTTVLSGGTLRVERSGMANSTTINVGGLLWVDNDGTGNNFTISNGGRLQVNAEGKITGWMEVYDGAVVSVYGTVDFDLTKTSTGATSSLLNNFYLLDNSGMSIRPNAYMLTIDGTQNGGSYKLADGAAGFNKTMTVQNTAGTELGTITVGGTDSVSFGGREYKLFLNDANLYVQVVATGGSDKVFTGVVSNEIKVISSGYEEQQSRVAQIDEIRAGVGNDIIDLTSQRFDYVGGGLTIRGGLGDDVIWANKGDNWLFRDEGEDRIVGASGNDVIVGGGGNDIVYGGGGDDNFVFGGEWDHDIVEQLDDGSSLLWFNGVERENMLLGSDIDGNAVLYCISGAVTLQGIQYADVSEAFAAGNDELMDGITLHFGDDDSAQYSELRAAGAFNEFTSEKVFEDKNKGLLA